MTQTPLSITELIKQQRREQGLNASPSSGLTKCTPPPYMYIDNSKYYFEYFAHCIGNLPKPCDQDWTVGNTPSNRKELRTNYHKEVNYWINTNKEYIDQLESEEKQTWKKEYDDYHMYKHEDKKQEQRQACRQLDLLLSDDQRLEIRRYQHMADKAMIRVNNRLCKKAEEQETLWEQKQEQRSNKKARSTTLEFENPSLTYPHLNLPKFHSPPSSINTTRLRR